MPHHFKYPFTLLFLNSRFQLLPQQLLFFSKSTDHLPTNTGSTILYTSASQVCLLPLTNISFIFFFSNKGQLSGTKTLIIYLQTISTPYSFFWKTKINYTRLTVSIFLPSQKERKFLSTFCCCSLRKSNPQWVFVFFVFVAPLLPIPFFSLNSTKIKIMFNTKKNKLRLKHHSPIRSSVSIWTNSQF